MAGEIKGVYVEAYMKNMGVGTVVMTKLKLFRMPA